MNKATIIRPLEELREYGELRERMRKETGILSLTGCVEAQKAHMIYGLSFDIPFVVIISENDLSAKTIFENLKFYVPEALYYPAKDLLFYQADVASNDLDVQRMAVMRAVIEAGEQAKSSGADVGQKKASAVIVLPTTALMDHVSTKETILSQRLTFEVGGVNDFEEVKRRLVLLGYERCAEAGMPGQFAFRGDILDIWPVTEDHPVRMEYFGDEVDSMRIYDPETQRSIENAERVTVYPANDHTGEENGELETFLSWFDADQTEFFLDEPNRVLDAAKASEEEFRESLSMRLLGGMNADGSTVTDSPGENEDFIPDITGAGQLVAVLNSRYSIALSMLDIRKENWKLLQTWSTNVQGVSAYNNSFEMLLGDLKRYCKNGYRVVVVSVSHTRAKRIAAGLSEAGLTAYYTEDLSVELVKGQVLVTYGHASRGFEYPFIRFALISDLDIFGEKKARRKRKKMEHPGGGKRLSALTELKVGDYVVHESYGIGIYRGINKIEVDGVARDYIKLEYSGSNLYILATQLDLLMKYAGSEGAKPRLNKIGDDRWRKTRARVKAATQSIAKELVDLYAVRQLENGFAYSPDSEWQKEFEELFPYEETEDQLAAIEDVKRDMESPKIMDRLICGDVGYGKTEIALRAAFKAVQDGKQVAYLVPTTILAQQHYQTFTQRMRDFPVRVDMLSRFRTDAQQSKTIRDLRNGLVDIVIGTHRLLSKDVVFKDLGLLVIDEEQRFGVKHKEKIKALRKNVDVLTMTATPIPRTLHMSLIGIRDMSTLEEAPEDRVPIQTYVMEYNPELVREAIARELARGGQVYYVYNRVNDIQEVTRRVQELVPEASVAYADGQMNRRDLEQIMVDFINGEIDVLVTTTIIETGLDIGNVNTIIIQDAERMGLAQLYQLRGRVGRTNRTAYAFMMYRRDRMLKEVAEKRLSAIREFTELGSGMKIAMRDLEIRGAGNLLGAEQSGHMEAVGYDLYAKMLAEAVDEAKGHETEEGFETVVDLALDAYIPDTYIPDESRKLDAYKKIAAISDDRDFDDMTDELLDRYGEIPKCVLNLMKIAELKARANRASIREIKESGKTVKLTVISEPKFDVARIPEIIQKFRGMFTIQVYPKETFFVYHGSREMGEMLKNLGGFCDALAEPAPEAGVEEQ